VWRADVYVGRIYVSALLRIPSLIFASALSRDEPVRTNDTGGDLKVLTHLFSLFLSKSRTENQQKGKGEQRTEEREEEHTAESKVV